jgi:hypothetical protein
VHHAFRRPLAVASTLPIGVQLGLALRCRGTVVLSNPATRGEIWMERGVSEPDSSTSDRFGPRVRSAARRDCMSLP